MSGKLEPIADRSNELSQIRCHPGAGSLWGLDDPDRRASRDL
jgi:hypothetical protein